MLWILNLGLGAWVLFKEAVDVGLDGGLDAGVECLAVADELAPGHLKRFAAKDAGGASFVVGIGIGQVAVNNCPSGFGAVAD